jgi:hypothetical protein
MPDDEMITHRAGADLRWFDGNVVHAVEGTHQDGIEVFWTLCHHDLPVGAVTDEERPVTCPECLAAARAG